VPVRGGEGRNTQLRTLIHCTQCKGKDQVILAQISTDREGPRRLVLPDFQTIGT